MSDRDRLIELINQGDKKCGEMRCKECEHEGTEKCGFNLIADYLLSNGVVKVVRCKECKYCQTLNHDLTTSYFCEVLKRPTIVEPTDFCSYGELKECEGE